MLIPPYTVYTAPSYRDGSIAVYADSVERERKKKSPREGGRENVKLQFVGENGLRRLKNPFEKGFLRIS
jgi:hypothetical protein